VEGTPGAAALQTLRTGVELRDGVTRPATARAIAPPQGLWPRDPPVPAHRHGATSWLHITLSEGRNRQVRRMTAAIGHPTLRLVRISVGSWSLGALRPGEWRRAAAPTTLRERQRRNRRR
jgi:23S rRNA pseudouridine2457 synthase